MFVHTVIMVIEPHMKQGRQHKLISTIFLATSVTKKLDHNTRLFWTDNRTETKLCVHIFMNGGITVRITFTLQINFHTPIAVNSIVRMIYFLNLCLDFGFKGIIIRLPVFPVVVISIWAYIQPSKQPANAKFIMILFDESISL